MTRVQGAGLVLLALLVLVLVAWLAGRAGGGEGSDTPAAAEGEAPAERVRVEVLNAAGVPGLARAATDRLRGSGFDVVYYGNAPGFHPDTSLVFDRTGRPEAAAKVAGAAEIERVRTQLDTALYVDVSVVLGRDWVGIPAPAERVPEGG